MVRVRSGSGLGGFLGHGMGLTFEDFKRVLKVSQEVTVMYTTRSIQQFTHLHNTPSISSSERVSVKTSCISAPNWSKWP